jgi:hypothetical protein
VGEINHWQEPSFAGMVRYGRPFETCSRVAVATPEDCIAKEDAHPSRHLRAMAGVAHDEPDPIGKAYSRKAVLRHIDEPTSAIVDLEIGEMREEYCQAGAKNCAALAIATLL